MKTMSKAVAGLALLCLVTIGGAIYAPAPVLAQAVGFFQQIGAGSVARSFLSKLRDHFSLRDFGAVADSTGVGNGTDNCNALTKAAAAAQVAGQALYIPGGGYRFSCGVSLTWPGSPIFNAIPRIYGDGRQNTVLNFDNGVMSAISFSSTTSLVALFEVQGLRIVKGDHLGNGIQAEGAWWSIKDLYVTGFEYGLICSDCLSSLVENTQLRSNSYGALFQIGTLSYPNAISFVSTDFGSNTEYGAKFIGCSALSITGGSVQGNGVGGTLGDNFGLKAENCGYEGAVGASISGVYFEFNKGTADLWITNTVNKAAHSVTGSTFNRISSTDFVTNNILVAATVQQNVSISGNGFKGFGSYVANAGRQYIATTGGSATIAALNNMYDSATETTRFPLPLVDGGTGAATASSARTNLGVAIGSNVQAWDADLDAFALKTAPSGAVVGTSDTQTISGKTISGASNTLTVREADLSTTDITTGNVSTSKHGFAPKLPNDAAKFLDGAGNYTVPPSSTFAIEGVSAASATQFAGGTTNFVTPALASTTESLVYLPSPSARTYKNLTAYTQGAPGASQTYTVTLRNAASDTAVTCTISGTGSNVCTDTTHTASASAADRWSIKFVTSAGAAVTNLVFSLQYTTP